MHLQLLPSELIALMLCLCHVVAGKDSEHNIQRYGNSGSSHSLAPFPRYLSPGWLRHSNNLQRSEVSSVLPFDSPLTNDNSHPELGTSMEEQPRAMENSTSPPSSSQNSTEDFFSYEISSEISMDFSTSTESISEGGEVANSTDYSSVFSSSESSSASTEEVEDVVLGTKHTPESVVPLPKSIYQKTIDWMEDAYTLSIVLPIAAGVLFAITIILTIATFRCFNRCCRRRRYRKKVLPDTLKNMRPSDRARLLGETSDEEF